MKDGKNLPRRLHDLDKTRTHTREQILQQNHIAYGIEVEVFDEQKHAVSESPGRRGMVAAVQTGYGGFRCWVFEG